MTPRWCFFACYLVIFPATLSPFCQSGSRLRAPWSRSQWRYGSLGNGEDPVHRVHVWWDTSDNSEWIRTSLVMDNLLPEKRCVDVNLSLSSPHACWQGRYKPNLQTCARFNRTADRWQRCTHQCIASGEQKQIATFSESNLILCWLSVLSVWCTYARTRMITYAMWCYRDVNLILLHIRTLKIL